MDKLKTKEETTW